MTPTDIVTESTETEFQRLSRDIKNATGTLNPRQARYIVDSYYQLQDYRIAAAGQARSMETDAEPHETISFFGNQMTTLENQMKSVLDTWTKNHELGQWARGQMGVGPVLAAGLLAHIDLRKAPTVGHIWSYAGLDPTREWISAKDSLAMVNEAFANSEDDMQAFNKLSNQTGRSLDKLLAMAGFDIDTFPDNDMTAGQRTAFAKQLSKRPWNGNLKVICWKIGESFVKVSGKEDAYYGQIYKERKAMEIQRNESVRVVPVGANIDFSFNVGTFVLDGNATTCYCINNIWYYGGNAKAAFDKLRKYNISKDTDAYASYSIGKLPPAHIHSRAKRYAVKLFLSHYHEVGRKQMGLDVPNPYPISHMQHVHYIAPPEGQAA